MNELCLKIVQNALKWPLGCSRQIFKNFLGKHAWGSMGKYARKSNKIWCPLPEKNFEYAAVIKHFQKAYLRPFLGLNVLTFLYLVNIQPNSKLHPPHQNFLDPLLAVILVDL